MTTLTPYVRKFLVLWAVIWILSFLLQPSTPFYFFELDPRGLAQGQLSAIPGILGYFLIHDRHSIFHLLLNGWMFALFAPEMERIFPGRRFLRFTLFVVLFGASIRFILAVLFPDVFHSRVIGASGLTMACLAGFAALFPGRRFSFFLIEVKALTLFFVVLSFDLVSFLLTFGGRGGGVAADIHLAGALAGWFLCAGFQKYPLPGKSKVARWKADIRRLREGNARRRLDMILQKISTHGIGSLSKGEKKFLEEESRKGR